MENFAFHLPQLIHLISSLFLITSYITLFELFKKLDDGKLHGAEMVKGQFLRQLKSKIIKILSLSLVNGGFYLFANSLFLCKNIAGRLRKH